MIEHNRRPPELSAGYGRITESGTLICGLCNRGEALRTPGPDASNATLARYAYRLDGWTRSKAAGVVHRRCLARWRAKGARQ